MTPTEIDTISAALISLARSNIPPDVQELLLNGNPDRGIPPGALGRLIEQVTGDLRSTAFHVISDIRQASGLGARPMLSELAGEIGKLRARAEVAEAALTGMEARAIAAEQGVASTGGITDAMVEVAYSIAGRFAPAGDSGLAVRVNYPTRESIRAALEAAFAPREG